MANMSVNPYESPKSAPSVQFVEAKCARGLVFGGWRDEFSFVVPNGDDIVDKIKNFYQGQSAKLAHDGPPIEFVRGHRLWSLVGLCSERRLLQQIRVTLEGNKQLTRIKLVYRVFVPFGFRIPPFAFSPEVNALASQLNALARSS